MLCHSNMKGEEHSCWPLRWSLGTRAEKAAEESKVSLAQGPGRCDSRHGQ